MDRNDIFMKEKTEIINDSVIYKLKQHVKVCEDDVKNLSYNYKELESMFRLNSSALSAFIQHEKFPQLIFNDRKYIKKSVIEEYINNKKLRHYVDCVKDYIELNDLCTNKEYDCTIYYANQLIEMNKIRYVFFREKYYIYLPSIINKKRYKHIEIDKRHEYYNYREIGEMFNLTCDSVERLVNKNKFKKVIFKGKNYILKLDIEEYLKINKLEHFISNIEEYALISKITIKYNTSQQFLYKLIKKSEVRYSLFNNKYYIYIPDFEKLKNRNEFYSYNELENIFNISYDMVRKFLNEIGIKKEYFLNKTYVKKTLIEDYILRNNLEHYILNKKSYLRIEKLVEKYEHNRSFFLELIKRCRVKYVLFRHRYMIYIPDIEGILSVNVEENKQDGFNIMESQVNKELYYSYDNLASLFSMTVESLRIFVDKEQFEKVKINGKNHIKKSTIDNYINRNNLTHFIENINEYIKIGILINNYNSSEYKIYRLIKDNRIRFVHFQGKYYLYKYDVIQGEKLIEYDIEKRDEYYDYEELMNLFHLSENSIRQFVKQENFEIKHFKNSNYVKKQVIDKYINSKNLKHFIDNNIDYIVLNNLCKTYTCSSSSVKRAIKSRNIKYVFFRNKYFIYLPEVMAWLDKIENIEKNKDYILISEAAKLLNVTEGSIRYNIKKGYLKNYYDFNSKRYISKSEIINLGDNKKKLNDLNWLIEYKLKKIATERMLDDTFELMKQYIEYIKNCKYDNSKQVIYLVKVFCKFLNNIKVDVYKIRDSELIFQFKMNIYGTNGNKVIMRFLKFIKNLIGERCEYSDNISLSCENKNKEVIAYSKETWKDYYEYATNVNLHITNAFNNKIYAETWLYIIFHFSNAWRAKDIVHLPSLDLDILGKKFDKIEDFNFNKDESIKLLKQLKIKIKERKTYKTNQKLILIMSDELLIPTIIVYALCSRNSKGEYVFTSFKSGRYPYRREYRKFFYERNNLIEFSNLKANKSLITYSESFVSNWKVGVGENEFIGKALRSHVSADTTAFYVDSDKITENISRQLCDRGNFGWLYTTLLDMTNIKKSFNNITKDIVKINKEVPYQNIEKISKMFIIEQKEKKLFIEQILNSDEINLKETILLLSKNKLASKDEFISCIKIKNCKNHFSDSCVFCSYSIPTVYSLVSINNYIKELLKNFILISDNNLNLRRKYTKMLMKILVVIEEAIQEFGKEYVYNILDYKYIKESSLRIEKLLLMR